MISINHKSSQSGFALLMSLIVVSVVISVALTLIELTIKQLRLSTGSRDSESAFHAANAMVECIRYWRVEEADAFEDGTGDTLSLQCFGTTGSPTLTDLTPGNGSDDIYAYNLQMQWSGGINRCSEVDMVTVSVEPDAAGDVTVTEATIATGVPGYAGGDVVCPPGGRCTIISSLGYNQPCTGINSLGTVQREILLEL
jgi:Tfp pilus assembly protein PilV